jgi:Lrp/AsnC family transcriptional regulator, regulator for asnA, asnC and gidA
MASNFDDLDDRLLEELKTDIRTPCTVLASKLGVSSGTVRRRLERLLEDKIVSLEVLPHPHKLEHNVTTFMGFRVRPGQGTRAAAKLALNPEFIYLSTTFGFYDLVGYAMFRSPDDIADFAVRELSHIEGIEWSETLLLLRICKHSRYGVVPGDPPTGEFDALDKRIVCALHEDVRASYASLSERLGISVPTVQQRVQRMLREGSIVFMPLINPSKIGYEVVATIGIRTNAALLTEVQRQLETNEHVHGFSMVAGRFDFLLRTYFPDLQHLRTFIQKDLSSTRGIEHYDVFLQMDVLRSSYDPVIRLI